MPGRFGHATHIVRVATLFLVGFIAFLIVRRAYIPADFGTLGFYRAGAIDEVRALPLGYAGRASCEECHVGKYWSDFDDAEAASAAAPVEDNKPFALGCESCHGPLMPHVVYQRKSDEEKEKVDEKPVPLVSADALCLNCHQQITGRPARQPQVLVGDHGDKDTCESCHRPHRPRTDEDVEG